MFFLILAVAYAGAAAQVMVQLNLGNFEIGDVPMEFDFSAGDAPFLPPEVANQARCSACSAFVAADLLVAGFRRRCPRQLQDTPSAAQLMSCVARSCTALTSVYAHLKHAAKHGVATTTKWPFNPAVYTDASEDLPTCRDVAADALAVPPHVSFLVSPPPLQRLDDEGEAIADPQRTVSPLALMALMLHVGPVAFAAPAVWSDRSRPECRWFLTLRGDAGPLGDGAAYDDLVLEAGLARCFEDESRFTHTMILGGWGFDESLGVPYWIVKNSWGSSWGAAGFFRVERWGTAMGIQTLRRPGYPHALRIARCDTRAKTHGRVIVPPLHG